MKSSFLVTALASAVLLTGCGSSGSHKTANLSHHGGFDSALASAAQKAVDQGAQKESLLFYEELYRRNAKDPQATLAYTKALRHDGQIKKAEIILEPWVGKETNLDIEYGRTLLALGHIHEAKNHIQALLKKNKNNGEAHHVLAIALDSLGQYQEAETHYRLAQEHWAGSPVPVLNNLALNLGAQNKRTEAIELIDRALIYAPHSDHLKQNKKLILALRADAPTPRTKPKE